MKLRYTNYFGKKKGLWSTIKLKQSTLRMDQRCGVYRGMLQVHATYDILILLFCFEKIIWVSDSTQLDTLKIIWSYVFQFVPSIYKYFE